MEGYGKKDHGDVKIQQTIMMGNFAKHINLKPHMQSIKIMTRIIKNAYNKGTNYQSNKIIDTQICILFCWLLFTTHNIWNRKKTIT
jgi:hypothetical protein